MAFPTAFRIARVSNACHILESCHAGPSQSAYAAFHSTARRFAKETEVKTEGRLRNENIPYQIVRLVNPETSRLDEPVRLSEILKTIDRRREWVELVSDTPENPVVKIIKGSAVYSKMLERKEKSRENRPREEKEFQMTWGIASADLGHKLKKVREHLEKGGRANVVYTSKKGQAQPTPQEMEARLNETVTLLEGVGKEWKTRDTTRTTAVMYLQGDNAPPPLPKRSEKKTQHNLLRQQE
ncbi:uncharacterized protein LAESUDRAFT_10873 [Laetiporus sulphureus 93-53]|uniref:Translation initiation factor 3 N-terminal domain-containing protein n=1 Tax=Laetiporus sulphureus 93-53 TaxID=1314785 RepID=A0A165I6V5_9APHY|nr:uncharacterized protein LAESUDRAFT_10873 [Laetiporus sulphureus 93-53]KZT12671.1 hypothetical protein LAESUDRAFT_10873 [Laetiporus sulphureus 93-53]